MMNRIVLAFTGVITLSVAACSTTSTNATSPASLSATALANKIPGCGSPITNTPSVLARQDVTCTLQDGAQIEIVTFTSSGDERQWISDGGYPSDPDPVYAGCCVEGNDWAATVGFNNSQGPTDVDYNQVISAIGGRQVTG